VSDSTRTIRIPASSLVLLVGAAGSGKSSFATKHFPAEATVSSDRLRAELGASEADQRVTEIVFERLHQIVDQRLRSRLLTVIDATNTDWMHRANLIGAARRHGRPAIGVVLDLPLAVCIAHNATRPRSVQPAVVRQQIAAVARDRDRFDLEGFASVYRLVSVEDLDQAVVEIEKGPVARALSR
jgi:protein phosphatase